ncbi:hypothetical protein BH23ACT9_BH23ACT9_40210 [soil metagenome]
MTSTATNPTRRRFDHVTITIDDDEDAPAATTKV